MSKTDPGAILILHLPLCITAEVLAREHSAGKKLAHSRHLGKGDVAIGDRGMVFH
jgi:hypothetical protein